MTDREVVNNDILPLFVVSTADPVEPLSIEGTGFLVAPGVLVTCWHCVSRQLPIGQQYAAVVSDGAGSYRAAPLRNVQQDANGSDLATANLDLRPTLCLSLGQSDVPYGTDVWTYGYAFTDFAQQPGSRRRFILNGRYFQGYVTRAFFYESRDFGRLPSYELSFPAPEGLSGSPVVRVGTKEVIGVVYHNNDVATISQFERVDPASGRREPEIQSIVSFGLAEHTDLLKNVRGKASQGRPLCDCLARVEC
jgi:hypothetical protein